MNFKTLALRSLLCLSVFASASEARNLFVLPGAATSPVNVFRGDPLTPAGSFTAPADAFQVLAHPSGAKYYVVSKSAADTVLVVDGSLSTVTKRINIGGGASAAALTPSGSRLLVTGTGLTIIDTTTDNVLPSSLTLDAGLTPIDVAVSHDSLRAFVLSAASNRVTTIDLFSNVQLGNTITIPGVATGITRGPNDVLYVSAPNRIFEIDGRTQAIRAEIPLNEFPGKVQFTPDGNRGVALNQNTVTGSIFITFDVTTRAVSRMQTILLPAVSFQKIVIAGNNRAFAVSAETRTLFDAVLDQPNATPATLGTPGGFSGVKDIVVSGEQPAAPAGTARYLYVASGTGLARVDLATNSPSGLVTTGPAPAALAFTGPANTGVPAGFSAFNTVQNLATIQALQALVVRVVDANNLPLQNVPVTFSTLTTGLIIEGSGVTTNAEGIALTTVVLPSGITTGTVSATIGSAGALVATFTLSQSGSLTGGVPAAMEIVSGNGQLVVQNQKTNIPMVIVLRDSNGAPVANSPVTWTLTSGNGNLVDSQTQTDAAGQALSHFFTGLLPQGFSSSQQTILAATTTLSKTFTLVTGATLPSATLVTPSSDPPQITGQAGSVLPAAVAIRLSTFLPGVGMRAAANVNLASTEASALCLGEGGTVLTDAVGNAQCDLKLGPKTGTANLIVNVGGYTDFSIPLTVTAGPPGQLRITQGNNQAGVPGQQMPLALVAVLSDTYGNILTRSAVTWEVVTPGTVTLTNVFSTSDGQGRVSALATLGNTAGPVQVRVSAGSASVTFVLNVNVSFSQLVKISGDGQVASVNRAFGAPIVVQVNDAAGRPVTGVSVNFAVSLGSASLSAAGVATDAQGRASVNVAAGPSAGPLVINVSAGALVASFNLTVQPPGPSLTASSFSNALNGQPGVTPGGITLITGTGLLPNVQGTIYANTGLGPLPTTFAGLTITFGGTAAPFLSATNSGGVESVVVQAPFELAPGITSVRVEGAGLPATVEGVRVLAYQPALLEQAIGGRRYGLVLRANGSFASPANAVAKGEIVRLYATGLGPVTPAAATGRAGIPGQLVRAPVVVGVNNAGVRMVNAQLAVNVVGVYEVDFQIPADAASGPALNLVVAVTPPEGGLIYSQSTLIAIQ